MKPNTLQVEEELKFILGAIFLNPPLDNFKISEIRPKLEWQEKELTKLFLFKLQEAQKEYGEEKFTKTEIEQLLSYCQDRDREGWYYGRRDQFEKRHKSILAKLHTQKEDL